MRIGRLLAVALACAACSAPPHDPHHADAGGADANELDAGLTDSHVPDAPVFDAIDAPVADATDGSLADATVDGALPDAGSPDASVPDAGSPDAGPPGPLLAYIADSAMDFVPELWLTRAHANAPSARLNAPLTIGSEIKWFEWSPDAIWIAYTQRTSTTYTHTDLYVVRVDAVSSFVPIRINPLLLPGSDANVDNIAWSPDGSKIVFRAGPLMSAQEGVYVVDLGSGSPSTPARVNGTLQSLEHSWSPNSELLTMRASNGLATNLYVVDLSSPSPPNPKIVNPELGNVVEASFHWSPDSTWLSFREEHIPDICHPSVTTPQSSCEELYIAKMGGTNPMAAERVNQELAAETSVIDQGWAPTSDRIWFRLRDDDSSTTSLHVASVSWSGPSVPEEVSGHGIAFEMIVYPNPVWSPTGDKILYLAADTALAVRRPELYFVDLGVGPSPPSTRLNNTLNSSAFGVYLNGNGLVGYGFSPAGNLAFYLSDELDGKRYNLFVVDINGAVPGTPMVVNPPLPLTAEVLPSISWSGPRVAYSADLAVADDLELWVTDTSVALGSAERVNGALVFNGDVSGWTIDTRGWSWSGDGLWLAYIADQTTNEVHELYTVRASGLGQSVSVSGPGTPGADVSRFRWEPSL